MIRDHSCVTWETFANSLDRGSIEIPGGYWEVGGWTPFRAVPFILASWVVREGSGVENKGLCVGLALSLSCSWTGLDSSSRGHLSQPAGKILVSGTVHPVPPDQY